MSSEPTTEAGKQLVKRLYEYDADDHPNANSAIKQAAGGMIAAIEAEAVAAYRADLEAKVRALPTWAMGWARDVPGDASKGTHLINSVDAAAVLRLLTDGAEPPEAAE